MQTSGKDFDKLPAEKQGSRSCAPCSTRRGLASAAVLAAAPPGPPALLLVLDLCRGACHILQQHLGISYCCRRQDARPLLGGVLRVACRLGLLLVLLLDAGLLLAACRG